jgi:hypothetical protein
LLSFQIVTALPFSLLACYILRTSPIYGLAWKSDENEDSVRSCKATMLMKFWLLLLLLDRGSVATFSVRSEWEERKSLFGSQL